ARVEAEALGRDLGPAARRRAEVDHARAFFEQAMLVVDLDQLERGAAAKTFALGPRHVGIVELPLEPAPRGDRAALRRFQPRLEPAPVRFYHGALAARSQIPSPRIICTSIPSRSPRSATRSRPQGNARRIASRMAQPASTRSARSAPMQPLATRSS